MVQLNGEFYANARSQGNLAHLRGFRSNNLGKQQHPRVPYRVVADSKAMGELMSQELIDVIAKNNKAGRATRAIVPCGPMAWYEPFTRKVNAEKLSLKKLTVFHMDECLDWQGRLLPKDHPLNFRSTMERVFYGPINTKLNVPTKQRFWDGAGKHAGLSQAILARAGGHLSRRLGPGWPYRIQSGAAGTVQHGDDRSTPPSGNADPE